MISKESCMIETDFLPHAWCICSSCGNEIKGLKNQEKQKCHRCGYEFEVDLSIRVIE